MTAKHTPSPAWIQSLAPYVPGKPASELERELGIRDIVKLASNENPLGPSPAAVAAAAAAAAEVHVYPDPTCHALRHALAPMLGVEASRVLIGNGSNELITLLARAFGTPGGNVVVSELGFVAYRICATAAGLAVRSVREIDMRADVDALIGACDANTRLLFFANPNNPTGTHVGGEALRRLVAGVPDHVLLVIDEAYAEYVDEAACPSALPLLNERENLVVMRTFSKAYGLAGLRVGYAAAPSYVAEVVNRVRDPFNVGHVAQAAALAALGDAEFLERARATNAAERPVIEAMLDDAGLRRWPSEGNFVMFEAPYDGRRLNDQLLRCGVIVRPLAAYGLPNHIRVTVGTAPQNQRFGAALRAALDDGAP
ncbi:MAG: histidinol-phosphate transaminase [Myxococcales bacterium]|nr:histidinol-phosphate transaminase [Myxococcales bacterium]